MTSNIIPCFCLSNDCCNGDQNDVFCQMRFTSSTRGFVNAVKSLTGACIVLFYANDEWGFLASKFITKMKKIVA